MSPESNSRRPRENAPTATLGDGTPPLNGIERARASEPERKPKPPKKKPDRAARRTEKEPDAVPAEIRERFIGVAGKYYFPDGKAAFTDHGTKLSTQSENTEVIASLISIAQAREWSEINVLGTERFRKEAWFAARLAGIEVQGYAPTEFEQERLVRAIARRESAAASPRLEERRAVPTSPQRAARQADPDGPITGRLVDHGRAPYQHRSTEAMSYYVRIETERGDRELWGVDLERAFRESLSRPSLGDEVTARAYGRDPVTVQTAQGELATHRNRWIIERRDFLTERAAAARLFRDAAIKPEQAVKEYPELQGSYLQLQAAKLGAERDIRDPQDQARFVARARTAIADAIERGEALEPVRLRERAEKTPQPEPPLSPEETLTR